MTWASTFDRTWLNDGGVVAALDGYVRRRTIAHRGLPPDHPAPGVTSVNVLVADARRFGTDRRWFWALCALGFLSELVICAELGTPSIKRAVIHHERNSLLSGLGVAITPVLLLRNALAHPASGAAPEDRFADLFVSWCRDNGEVELARRLQSRWMLIPSEDVSLVALRRLDSAGPILRRLA